MTADDFERAILAEPAADAPRLVYADWLDETGDPANAARAEYIRLQCEAAGLSDLDHRRHLLEWRASAIFREHGLDWWRPVCRRLNLPEPALKPESLWGRLRRFVREEWPTGWPYQPGHSYRGDHLFRYRSHDVPAPLRAFVYAKFARGFVDELDISGDEPGGPSVADWLAAVPAVGLALGCRGAADFAPDDTPALRTVRKLSLDFAGSQDAAACLWSPYLTGLDELVLQTQHEGVTAGELRAVAAAPAAPRVRRLELGLATAPAAALVESFVNLRDLTVTLEPDGTADRPAGVTACVAHLAGLRSRLERLSLFTHGDLPPAGFAELTRRPWPSLRTLELLDPLVPGDVRALSADAFPVLSELLVVPWEKDADVLLDELAQWPAVRRLTRLCFAGGTAMAAPDRLLKLAAVMNLDVLQTFHLEPHEDATLEARLRAILGDRLWMG